MSKYKIVCTLELEVGFLIAPVRIRFLDAPKSEVSGVVVRDLDFMRLSKNKIQSSNFYARGLVGADLVRIRLGRLVYL